MVNNSYKTAIRRGGPSTPIKELEKFWQRARLLEDGMRFKDFFRLNKYKALDYGSGRGEDADYLGASEYDPYWYPAVVEGRFDFIFCTYVLNVVDQEDQEKILDRLDNLSNPGARIFVTVRRDIPITGKSLNGYDQRYVHADDLIRRGYNSTIYKTGAFQTFVKYFRKEEDE